MRLAERLGPFGREPWLVLAPLLLVQWIAVAVYALRVQRNGWLFYQGGDQTWFYTSGWILAGGHIPESIVGWVWALAMAPIAAVAGPSYLAGAPAVVLLQFLLLLPLGVVCVYAIASRIGGRPLGYWAAAWWVAIPFLVVPLFAERYQERWTEQTLPQALGLTGLGDFPSMIAVLASAVFVVRALDTRSSTDVVLAGLLAGLAVGIKPANGLFVFAPVAALLLARNPRAVVNFSLALLPGLVVLAVWKYRGSGIPLLGLESAAYAAADEVPDFSPPTFRERLAEYVPFDHHQLNLHFIYFREFFWSARVLEWVPLAGLVAVARRSVPLAGLLAVWLAAFFVIKGSSPVASVESGSFWRLLMPAWPAYFLLAISIPLLVPRLAQRLLGAVRPPRPPRVASRALLVGAVVAFAVPAVALAALPPERNGRVAKMEHQSLFLPIDASFLPAAAAAADGSIELTWPEATGAARPFYVVLRSERRYRYEATGEIVTRGHLCREGHGALRCALQMEEVGRTRDRTFNDRPPRGEWTYRIGVAANWRDDPEGGDVLVVSEGLDVAVR